MRHPEHEEGGLGWKIGTHVVYKHTQGSRFAGVKIDGMHGVVVSKAGEVLWQDGEVRTPLPWNIEPLDHMNEEGRITHYQVCTPIDNKFMPKGVLDRTDVGWCTYHKKRYTHHTEQEAIEDDNPRSPKG